MTGIEYRRRIEARGFTVSRASRFFGVSPATGWRWVNDGPPQTVAIVIALLDELGADADRAEEITRRRL